MSKYVWIHHDLIPAARVFKCYRQRPEYDGEYVGEYVQVDVSRTEHARSLLCMEGLRSVMSLWFNQPTAKAWKDLAQTIVDSPVVEALFLDDPNEYIKLLGCTSR